MKKKLNYKMETKKKYRIKKNKKKKGKKANFVQTQRFTQDRVSLLSLLEKGLVSEMRCAKERRESGDRNGLIQAVCRLRNV